MAQQNATLADDYTEFNGDFPTLLVGKTMSTRMGEVTPNDKAMYSDLQNARVQVYGDTAILTYNFAGLRRGADGKVNPSLAKSTRVYVKQGGQWKLVHANFAPVRFRRPTGQSDKESPALGAGAPRHSHSIVPGGFAYNRRRRG